MDIAASANRRSIAEVLRHLLDSAQNGLFSLRLGVEKLEFLQCFGRKFCPGPCPKILRRDLLASDLAQIVIYLRRADRVPNPLSSRYWNSSYPGRSRQFLIMRA